MGFIIIRRKYDEIKQNNAESHCEKTSQHEMENVPDNIELVTSEGYDRYIDAHGYHFTHALAEYASSMMKNADGSGHTWSVRQVDNALRELGIDIPKTSCVADMAYTANMAYADFFPYVLREEVLCLKYASAVAHDIDGYEGQAFYRWLSDVMAVNGRIDWERFI